LSQQSFHCSDYNNDKVLEIVTLNVKTKTHFYHWLPFISTIVCYAVFRYFVDFY